MQASVLQSPNNPTALAAAPAYTPLPVNGLVSPAITFGTPALPSTATKTIVTAKPAVTDYQAKQGNVQNVAAAMAAPQPQAQQQATAQTQPQQPAQPQPPGQQPTTQTPTAPPSTTTDQLLKMIQSGSVSLTSDQVRQVAGLNATGFQQNPDGTYTADASAKARLATQTPTQPPSTGDPQQDYIQNQRAQLDQQAQANYDNYTSQLQQIANGSFPLTQSQQAQMNALQSQFDALKQQQILANKNYEGAVTNLGIRAGRSRYAPEIEQSNIQAAINLGLSKVADIDAKSATAMANLQQGFADNNYKLINAQYGALQDLMTEKDNSLKEMQQSIKDQMDMQTQKLTQQKALMDIETSTINNTAQAVLNDALNSDGSLNFDLIQQAATDYGVDPNQLYSAVLKQKDDYDAMQREEQKFATDQQTAKLNQQKTQNDINQAPLDVAYKNAQIASLKANTAKTNAEALAAQTANTPSSGDFAATIDLAANTGGSVYQQKAIKQALTNAVANKDYKSAYAQIVQAAANGLGGTAGTNFEQQVGSLTVLDNLQKAIQAYADAGGNTNILKGKEDQIQTKIGALATDPQYAALATQLDAAFQQYRLNMTGAAFGDKESAEYAAVLPNKGNTLDLNLAKLTGAKAYLNSAVSGGIKAAGLGDGALYIKDYAERTVTAPDGSEVIIKD